MHSRPQYQLNMLNKFLGGTGRALRFILPFLLFMSLTACTAHGVGYQGTCEEQIEQFLGDIRALVINDLNPAIVDGFKAGPSAEVMQKLDEVSSSAYALQAPACNPGTRQVKEALQLYLLETKNYFNVVAGRAVYGEGSVQAQRSKMDAAGWNFEMAYDDLKR